MHFLSKENLILRQVPETFDISIDELAFGLDCLSILL